MIRLKRVGASLFAAALMAVGLAGPASAHPPVFAGHLVTVTIIDFADVNVEDVTVQIPVAAAANVCDTTVAALLAEIEDEGSADCDATASSNANR